MPFSAQLAGTKRRTGNIVWQQDLQHRPAKDETSGAAQEKSGREHRNEYRAFRRQLRPHTSRTSGPGPGGRQPLLSAAGAVCVGGCSSGLGGGGGGGGGGW